MIDVYVMNWFKDHTSNRMLRQNSGTSALWIVAVPRIMNLVKQSSWEANSCKASQKKSEHFMQSGGSVRVHKEPLTLSMLSLMNSDHTLSPCFLKIHFNIILPSVNTLTTFCIYLPSCSLYCTDLGGQLQSPQVLWPLLGPLCAPRLVRALVVLAEPEQT
jgi:hypothetical protein